MEINLILLQEYCKKIGMDVTFNISIESNEGVLIAIMGNDKDGSRREYLSFTDIDELLTLNGIIGEGSEVEKTLSEFRNQAIGRKEDPTKKINDLIYGTTAKYIIQLLSASVGKNLFPGLKPLEKDRNHFQLS